MSRAETSDRIVADLGAALTEAEGAAWLAQARARGYTALLDDGGRVWTDAPPALRAVADPEAIRRALEAAGPSARLCAICRHPLDPAADDAAVCAPCAAWLDTERAAATAGRRPDVLARLDALRRGEGPRTAPTLEALLAWVWGRLC